MRTPLGTEKEQQKKHHEHCMKEVFSTTNEQLAILVRNSDGNAILPLWDGVRLFAMKMANRWIRAWDGRGGVELDDLEQCAFLALFPACESFDPEKGSFLTHYGYYIKKAFMEAFGVRTSRRDPLLDAGSLDAPLPGGESDGITLGDMQPDPASEVAYSQIEEDDWLRDLHNTLDEALNTLPVQYADAIRRRFYNGETAQISAERAGVTPEEIRRRTEKGFTMIRRGQKLTKRLREFCPYRGTGYGAWLRTGCSIEEKYLLLKERYGEK